MYFKTCLPLQGSDPISSRESEKSTSLVHLDTCTPVSQYGDVSELLRENIRGDRSITKYQISISLTL